jgi:hypothetical protein
MAEATENRLSIGPDLRFRGGDSGLARLHGAGIVGALRGVQLGQRVRERSLVRLHDRLRVLVKLAEVLPGLHAREAQPRAIRRHRCRVAGRFVAFELLHQAPCGRLILLDHRPIGLQVRRQRRLRRRL